MILIARNVGGTLEAYAPQRPDASPTVVIVNQSGGTEVASTAATLDSVDTTLSEGADEGTDTVTVTSASSITVGRRYLISGQNARSEVVEVAQLDGTSVSLASPLVYDHPNTSDFEGTRLTYDLTSSVADLEEENWRAEFSWAVSAVAQAPLVVEFTVTRHPIYNPAAIPDLFAVEPMLRRKLAAGTDIGGALTRAWDEVLEILHAESVRVSTLVGSAKAKRAVVYHCLRLLAEQYGREYASERKEWQERATQALSVFKGVAAIDDDEDGALEPHEKRSARGGELFRA